MGEYELLSKIKSPHDVKKLNDEQLKKAVYRNKGKAR